MTDPETREPGPSTKQARQRRTRWPGWVWLIPLVAFAFAGWLAVEEWVVGPHPLTVHFSSVEGIKPGAPVRYKGVQVGSVDSIRLDDDLDGATLRLDMTALDGRLGEGTRIWIERPSLAPGALGSLLSGPYLAIAPGGEGEMDELRALEEAPIVLPDEAGRVFVLTDETGEGLSAGAPVTYRGIRVGRVLGKRFGEGGGVEIPVFVEGAFAEMVRAATVFWRAGGLSVDTAGGLSVDFPSLAAIATGAVAFETPEVMQGPPAEPGSRLALWDSRDAAATAATGPRLAYRVVFAKPVGDLARGAPVTLAGKQIGRVAGTGLEVAPDGSGLITPVTIVIDARKMSMDDLGELDSREALRERLNTILSRLVAVGMRAQIAEGGIVFGARSVELAIDSEAAPAEFSPDAPVPEIPAAGGLAERASVSEGGAPGAAAAGTEAGGNAGTEAAGDSAEGSAERGAADAPPNTASEQSRSETESTGDGSGTDATPSDTGGSDNPDAEPQTGDSQPTDAGGADEQ